MSTNPSVLAVHDPELGTIAVNDRGHGEVHLGASDGWRPTPEVKGLLKQLRHGGRA